MADDDITFYTRAAYRDGIEAERARTLAHLTTVAATLRPAADAPDEVWDNFEPPAGAAEVVDAVIRFVRSGEAA